MAPRYYLGVDVGTGSARAGIFDERGVRAGLASYPIRKWQPQHNFHEQSSEDIWRACCVAIHEALGRARIPPSSIRGIGFDATCSLVALDANDRPVSISPSGEPDQNIILWMDHRAITQANRINATKHSALRSVGGTISPEMEIPKLLWLKEHLPEAWRKTARFLDLADFLSYRATGSDVRSLCTTTCKWNYSAPEKRWNDEFLHTVGLGDLAADGYARIGREVKMQGERAGVLLPGAATELGLEAGTPVATSIIDAHAGALGLLGMHIDGLDDSFETRLAIISGSSTCQMATSRQERYVQGVWGPYYSAMIPGFWLAEGGQSATGTLIDHIVYGHAASSELLTREASEGVTAYEILNARLAELAAGLPFAARLTRDVHVYPDFHGNRSPLADPTLRGMISGLTMESSLDSLAILYLATLQALAHGTRHIIDRLNAGGYSIRTLFACGGGTKNEVLLQEHTNVTGCTLVLPEESEAVLLGAAILGAVASSDQPSIEPAMRSMSRPGRLISPVAGAVAQYHAAKHQVFAAMLEHQRSYSDIMIRECS